MSLVRACFLLAALLTCGTLAACSDNGGGDAGSAGCSAPTNCDITQTACQRAVMTLTACVRGDAAPKLPAFRVVTPAQLRTELEQEAKDSGGDTSFDKALAGFGLLPAGKSGNEAAVDLQVDNLAAYYDDQKKRVTVIDTGSNDQTNRMYVLSHELTHYLQDKTTGFDKLRKRFSGSSDQTIALSALVEGEAIATSTHALAVILGRSESDIDWDKLFTGMLDDILDGLASSDAPLFYAAEQLPYPLGGRYVEAVWEDYGRSHVDALFHTSPMSLLDWKVGYGDGKVKPSLLQPLDCAPPLAPAGLMFELHGLDSLGFAGALALLAAAPQPNTDARTAARADYDLAGTLRGDAIAVYTLMHAADTAPVLAAWRLRFADESSARTVQARVDAALDVTSKRFGKELLLVTRDAGDVYTDDELAACPKLEDFKPVSPSDTMTALRRIASLRR